MATPQTTQNDIAGTIATLAQRQAARPQGAKVSGPKRAAMLMLALGEQYGAKVWQMLDDDEIRELSIVMSSLGTIEADVVEDLLLEFVSRMSASGALMGNFDATERLLQQYLPKERVNGIMDEIRGPAGRNMWEKLSNVQEEVLANYLKNEYPQTIAVVLSKLTAEHAARVLAILPEDLALDVVGRMLKMEAVQKEVIERVEQTLRLEFMSNLSQTRRRDAHEVMAEIFNNFDRQTETRFITALEEENRESAERIKALMFTFDDLVKLDTASAQTLMRHVDKEKLGVALKGANEDIRTFFLGNMSSRAAKMLLDDMQALGPVRLARRGRSAGAAGQPRQGSRRQGRDHAGEGPRRRRTGVLEWALPQNSCSIRTSPRRRAATPRTRPTSPARWRRPKRRLRAPAMPRARRMRPRKPCGATPWRWRRLRESSAASRPASARLKRGSKPKPWISPSPWRGNSAQS